MGLNIVLPLPGEQKPDPYIIMLVEEGTITQCDRKLIQYAETAEQAWHLILESYAVNGNNHSDKKKATL
jgi:predicted Rossmann-fold nucleotide-binding protein